MLLIFTHEMYSKELKNESQGDIFNRYKFKTNEYFTFYQSEFMIDDKINFSTL